MSARGYVLGLVMAVLVAELRTSPAAAQVPLRTLLAERVVPNPPLPPLEVTVDNNHTQNLVVGYVDLRKTPPRPKEKVMKPGESQKYLLERDSGATIERTYEVITPAGAVLVEVERVPVPPVRIWDLVVWEYKTTYYVVGQPELDQKSRRSIGVVPLPPGTLMPSRVDVFQEAVDQKNPGAAAAYLNAKETLPTSPPGTPP